MTNDAWIWANLSDDQLELIGKAEQSLGADYLLVYNSASQSSPTASAVSTLKPASLTESQLECLQGLESQLQAVVVAYNDRPAS